jgi:hypothetical protein
MALILVYDEKKSVIWESKAFTEKPVHEWVESASTVLIIHNQQLI